jgi:alpha-amylase
MNEWISGKKSSSIFNNFFLKYPEANNMHKKMLYVSEKVRLNKNRAAQIELYKAQCNCAYWHGIFGGVYLLHLRKAVYEHLIKSEKLIEDDKFAIKKFDFNKDAKDELLIETKFFNLYFNSCGNLFEFDYKEKNYNLSNVMSRHKEPYHDKIKKKVNVNDKDKSVKSIHEIFSQKEEQLAALLEYDDYIRYSLIDHFYVNAQHKQFIFDNNFINNIIADGKKIEIEFIFNASKKLKMNKKISVYRDKKAISVRYAIDNHYINADCVFCIEFNLLVKPVQYAHLFTDFIELKAIDDSFNILIDLKNASDAYFYPIETVSLSESGAERTYQGLNILIKNKINKLWQKEFDIIIK